MTKVVHVVGIDPGLVHTGLVRMEFMPLSRMIYTSHELLSGPNALGCKMWVEQRRGAKVFIEDYVPRSHLTSDRRMVEGVAAIAKETGGRRLKNTGVKKTVKPDLMRLLGVWSFTTPSHHQDLRSAARIALLGMLKEERMNKLLSDIVRDYQQGKAWVVQ